MVGGTRESNDEKGRAELKQRGAAVEGGRRMVSGGWWVVGGARWMVDSGGRMVDGGWRKVDDGWCMVKIEHGVGVQMFVRLDASVWCSCRCVVGDVLWGLQGLVCLSQVI